MAMRRRLKNKKPPEGWELIEEVVEDFELQVGVMPLLQICQALPRLDPGALTVHRLLCAARGWFEMLLVLRCLADEGGSERGARG